MTLACPVLQATALDAHASAHHRRVESLFESLKVGCSITLSLIES